jgi:hypothetical protein
MENKDNKQKDTTQKPERFRRIAKRAVKDLEQSYLRLMQEIKKAGQLEFLELFIEIQTDNVEEISKQRLPVEDLTDFANWMSAQIDFHQSMAVEFGRLYLYTKGKADEIKLKQSSGKVKGKTN